MATITININAKINQPPDELGDADVYTPYGINYIFTKADFTTNTIDGIYHDPENDEPLALMFLFEWTASDGSFLKYDGVDISEGVIIPFSDIELGKLIFYPSPTTDIAGEDYEGSAFTISDVGSGEFSSLQRKTYITVYPL